MNDFLIKDTLGKGKGLFSNVHFDKNSVLFKFSGTPLTLEEENYKEKYPNCDRFLQIAPNLYLNLENDFTVFSNHDCNPNAYIKIVVNNAFLIAAREINKGDEITFDYSLTSTDAPETWSMKCVCSPFNCRKVISGFGSIPKGKQEALIKAGHVPKYIIKHYGI